MLISTDKFQPACQSMASISGIPDIQWAIVPHPLGSLPPDVLMERARSAVEQFERIVLEDPNLG